MRIPAYSILTMTGPNRLLNYIAEMGLQIDETAFTITCEESIEQYANWIGLLLKHFGFQTQKTKSVLDLFTRVVRFPIGDSYGAFPDTSGYDTPKDWENYETDAEDPALMNYMHRGVEAVFDNLEAGAQKMAESYNDVEDFINTPKFAGLVFLCVGVVMIGEKTESKIIQVPKGTTVKKLQDQNSLENLLVDQGIVTLN